MKKSFLFLITSSVLTIANAQPIIGFSKAASDAERATEKQFDANLKATNVDQYIKDMSARPHAVGSAFDKINAEYLLAKFKGWGYDANIETFYVLFPTPLGRLLEMNGDKPFKASLKEPALPEDATSGQASEQLPVYNAWSADGDVTAPLVFVNYGVPADYEILARMGIDVKGKIVIAKYGQSWRGIKPKVAQEHGAIGCIIYSDPKDDGYGAGDVYPKGPFRPAFGAQRGSVEDMPIYPGDPLTPGVGATKDAKRLDRKDATNLLKIPVIPISYADAQPLLESLEGAVVPAAWRGGLPITYHVGPSKNTVHLKLNFDWQIRPIYDVIAKIKGSEFPNEWVMRGNHHDAWVNGAGDPLSGQAAMLEEARSIGELMKTGWKPKRTLVFAAWDGEEPGLLGSTEWVETHADELQQKLVLYINSDGNGKGFLGAEGSHALEPVMTEIAKDVTDPETGVSVFQRRKSEGIVNAPTPKGKKDLMAKNDITLGGLGSGSDFSPFFQHLGIPSLNLGFGGEDEGGEYHSIYDSYDLYRRFKDPTFAYGVALAKVAGRTTLRFADAEMLQFDYRSLQKTIAQYETEVVALTDNMRDATALENQMITGKYYALANDPSKPLNDPTIKSEVPFLNFAPLQNAVLNLEKISNRLADTLSKANLSAAAKDAINIKMYQAEQALLLKDGLPRRGWYKHSIYAPGFYTGYGVKTLPGIREAVEQRNWKEAQDMIEMTAGAINHFGDYLVGVEALVK